MCFHMLIAAGNSHLFTNVFIRDVDGDLAEPPFAADPKLIYRIAEGGGKCIDWILCQDSCV